MSGNVVTNTITEVHPGNPEYHDDPEAPTVGRVFRLRGVGFRGKGVLVTLALRKDLDGIDSLPLDVLAQTEQVTVRTLRKRLKALHEAGLIAPVPPDRWALTLPDSLFGEALS
jgi:hypothetical protein